jgi:hypothetical protein
MAKYTVKFKVDAFLVDPTRLEAEIKDLIQVAVLPTLNLELVPLTFEVKKARN